MPGMRRYAHLLREPSVAVLFAAGLLCRLPLGLNGLAIILYLREETGSFAAPGAAAAGLSIGFGIGAPMMGRLLDRRGARLLVPMAVAHGAALVGFLAAGSTGAPPAVLVGLATLAGVVFPPTPSVLRAVLPDLLAGRPDLVRAGFALDSVLLEITFVGGPLLVGLLVVLLGPGAAIALSAVVVVLGAAAFQLALPGGLAAGGATVPRDLLGALRSPGLRVLVATMLPFGFVFGAIEIALTAFGREESGPAAAAVLIAAWSLGSVAGGLVYGSRASAHGGPQADLFVRLTVALPVGVALLALGWSVPSMALIAIPAGVVIAPIIALRNELARSLAPDGHETEALTWPITALTAGIALGAAFAGAIVDGAGWQVTVVAGAAAAALTAVLTVAARPTLRTGAPV